MKIISDYRITLFSTNVFCIPFGVVVRTQLKSYLRSDPLRKIKAFGDAVKAKGILTPADRIPEGVYLTLRGF
jgi:hypothetical protein